MFIECTSRDNNPRNELTNADAGRTVEGMFLINLLSLVIRITDFHTYYYD